jgi:hypothetical protein
VIVALHESRGSKLVFCAVQRIQPILRRGHNPLRGRRMPRSKWFLLGGHHHKARLAVLSPERQEYWARCSGFVTQTRFLIVPKLRCASVSRYGVRRARFLAVALLLASARKAVHKAGVTGFSLKTGQGRSQFSTKLDRSLPDSQSSSRKNSQTQRRNIANARCLRSCR